MNKTFNKFVAANKAKIADAYKGADGYYDVIMNGYCDDGDYGRHTIIDSSVNELMRRVRKAVPCQCETCKAGINPLDVVA